MSIRRVSGGVSPAPTSEVRALPPPARAILAPARAVTPRGFDAGYWNALARLAGAGPLTATSLLPLRDHVKALEQRIAIVESASTPVVGTLYFLKANPGCLRFLDALIDARERGVEVVVGIDLIAEITLALEHTLATNTGRVLPPVESESVYRRVLRWATSPEWFASRRLPS